jgi:glycosyltransferase involved in cell wall biosynthesis
MKSKKPYSIAIDARSYRRSTAGVGRYTRALIHNLQMLDTDNNYTVILTPEDYKEWPVDTTPSNWRTEVLDVPIYSVAEQTRLRSFLLKNKFDLVHFTMFNHPIGYNRPFVVTIHDLTMSLFPLRGYFHPRSLAYRFVMQHAATHAKHIIVPSEATKNDVIKILKAPSTKITTTYEAVEPEFKPQTNTKQLELVKQKYGITKPFLFFVNSWRPHKGLPDLIDAFLAVKQECDIQLLVSSKPNPAFPEIVQAVESAKSTSGDIFTPGFIPDEDIISLYSLAASFVFPSHYEGFGLGALEAIACGCPTIAAQNSSLPEVLGDAGLYYPTGDTKALAKTIKMLLADPALSADLKSKGLEQAARFSFVTMAHQTQAIYTTILSG